MMTEEYERTMIISRRNDYCHENQFITIRSLLQYFVTKLICTQVLISYSPLESVIPCWVIAKLASASGKQGLS